MYLPEYKSMRERALAYKTLNFKSLNTNSITKVRLNYRVDTTIAWKKSYMSCTNENEEKEIWQ